MGKPEGFADALIFGKLVRVHILDDLYIALRRAQVLTDGEGGDSVGDTVTHEFFDLFGRLTKAYHNAGLGDKPSVSDGTQDLEARVVGRTVAYRRGEPAYGLKIVADDIRLDIEHLLKAVEIPLEVRDEHFDGCLGASLLDRPHTSRPMSCAIIVHIVPVDRSDDGILELHLSDTGGETTRFERIDGCRLGAGVGGAEATSSGAVVATDHECRRATTPTLVHVGTPSAGTYRVQTS